MKEIERGKAAVRHLQVANNTIELMSERISLKDSAIEVYENKIQAFGTLTANYDQQIKVLKSQQSLTANWLEDTTRKLRRQKRKTVFTAILGVVATGAAIYFMK